MICGSGWSKSNLAKAAGAEPSGQMRNEKLHAVVARSTFPSQHVQNTPGSDQNVKKTQGSDHFWKLRCGKSARRCGAGHMSKSKCTKHTRFGHFLDVQNARVLWPLQLQPPVHYTTLRYNRLHCTTLHYTILNHTTLHYTTITTTATATRTMTATVTTTTTTSLRYTRLHYTTLVTVHYPTIHATTQHST